MAKYQIEISEIKENMGCGQMLFWLILILIGAAWLGSHK
jgi:hypothetical protein